MARSPQYLNIYSGTDATGNSSTVVAEDMTTAAKVYQQTHEADPIILQRTKANVLTVLPDIYITFRAQAFDQTTNQVTSKNRVTPKTYTVLAGTKVLFTAEADEGYEFVKWVINGEDVVGDEATSTVAYLTIPDTTNDCIVRGVFKLVD